MVQFGPASKKKIKELNRLQQEERACSVCGNDREMKFISFKSDFAEVEAAHKQAFLLSSLQPLGPINNNENNYSHNDESAACLSVLGGSAPAQQ